MTPALAAAECTVPGAAGPHVVGEDRHDRPALAPLDHVPAHRARAVEGPVEHDADHRVPAVRRQILGAADEIAGRVVDQDVDAAVVLARRARPSRRPAREVARRPAPRADRARRARSSAWPRSRFAELRLPMATCAPSSPSRFAIARPMPVPPPVMIDDLILEQTRARTWRQITSAVSTWTLARPRATQ